MPGRMLETDLRPELRDKGAHPVTIATLDLMAERLRLVAAFRQHGATGTTYVDAVISVYLYAWRDEGTRAQSLIDYLAVPRGTIRDSLSRMERNSLTVRDDGLYYPTALVATVFNETVEDAMKKITRLCDAVAEYREMGGNRL